MNKVNKYQVMLELGKLFDKPFADGETLHDRANLIDNFISSTGWTWDDIIGNVVPEDMALL